MSRILILTGACGVGKSTIAKHWANSQQGAYIESDYFRAWNMSGIYERFSVEEELLIADVSLNVALSYLKKKIPVVIENVWTPQGLQFLIAGIKSYDQSFPVKVVYLKCKLTENHRRDQLRIFENQMKDRVNIVNSEFEEYEWPEFVNVLDTSQLSVKETLVRIFNIANDSVQI